MHGKESAGDIVERRHKNQPRAPYLALKGGASTEIIRFLGAKNHWFLCCSGALIDRRIFGTPEAVHPLVKTRGFPASVGDFCGGEIT